MALIEDIYNVHELNFEDADKDTWSSYIVIQEMRTPPRYDLTRSVLTIMTYENLLEMREEMQYLEFFNDYIATSAQDYVFNSLLRKLRLDEKKEIEEQQLLLINCSVSVGIARTRKWSIKTTCREKAESILRNITTVQATNASVYYYDAINPDRAKNIFV